MTPASNTPKRLRELRWRIRALWWQKVAGRVHRWFDRRYEDRHLREYGWPLGLGMGPWSPERFWHVSANCQDGHAWERIDWPYGRHVRRGHRPDRITRCRTCGAPRCDTYHSYPDHVLPNDDAAQQFFRCTAERHHDGPHDYLTGVQIEVGA